MLGCNILIETNVIVLHHPPMPPFEGDRWWTTVHLDYLPSKCGHHSFEGLVAGCKVGVLWTIVLVRLNDGVVSTDMEHVFR